MYIYTPYTDTVCADVSAACTHIYTLYQHCTRFPNFTTNQQINPARSNIHQSVTADQLRIVFSPFGTVLSCNLVAGTAVITFDNASSAAEAQAGLRYYHYHSYFNRYSYSYLERQHHVSVLVCCLFVFFFSLRYFCIH